MRAADRPGPCRYREVDGAATLLAMLWVRPRRRTAVSISSWRILIGAVGVVVTIPIIVSSPVAALLACVFLSLPVLTWRHIGRTGRLVTVRRVFGSRQLEADRCTIGYRSEGGYRWAELTVYLTDGVRTVNLAEHPPYRAGPAERDVARLTALLLDPHPAGVGAAGTGRPGNVAARRRVEEDQKRIATGREYARAYYGGRDWWVSRKFWLTLVLLLGGALLYSTVMFVLLP